MALQVRNLHKQYGGRPVVNNVNFEVERGEIVGLLGPNGAGKTTSFYSVVGIIRPDQGEILIDGHNISKLPIHTRARAGIGYLPQETSVFRTLTVEENLKLVQEFQEGPADVKAQQLETLLDEFGLQRHRKSPAIQLSGGERRRVEIARAIAASPQYLLLDEPFTGIDPIAIQDIQQLVKQLKTRGLGILLTDHNPKATLSIVTGRILLTTAPYFLPAPGKKPPTTPWSEYYLGQDFRL